MSIERASNALLALPGEMHNKIMSQLEPMDLLMLRSTCRYFRNIIPLSMSNLLVAEGTETAMEQGLYACRMCLRLRRARRFADKMMKKDKRKLEGANRHNRFCVDCGINPPPGENGYSRGALITQDREESVICMNCAQLKPPAYYQSGVCTKWCTECWATTPQGREMERERQRSEAARLQREQERRQRELDERAERRRRRRELLGSDAEDTDEDIGEDADSYDKYEYYEEDIGCMDWRDIYL